MEKIYELAEQGSVLANQMLDVYISASGNHEESCYWMRKAVERNFPPAQYELAWLLLKESVIRFSPQEQREKAVEFLRQSSASGYTPSLKQLSKAHKKGVFVEKNKPQVLQLYQQVTEQHNFLFHYYLTGSAIRNKYRTLFLK